MTSVGERPAWNIHPPYNVRAAGSWSTYQKECYWIGRRYFCSLEMAAKNERNVGVHSRKCIPAHSRGPGQTPELDIGRSFLSDVASSAAGLWRDAVCLGQSKEPPLVWCSACRYYLRGRQKEEGTLLWLGISLKLLLK